MEAAEAVGRSCGSRWQKLLVEALEEGVRCWMFGNLEAQKTYIRECKLLSKKKNAMDHQHCKNCGGNDLVIKYQRGTIVCRGCGVVAEMNILDDRPYDMGDYHEYLENIDCDQEIAYVCDSLYIPEYLKFNCQEKFKNIKKEKSFKAQNVLLCKTVVVYLVCLENNICRTPDEFQQIIGVPQAKFNLMLKELQGVEKDDIDGNKGAKEEQNLEVLSMRKRLYGLACSIIKDNRERNRVLNECEKYEAKLVNENEYMNKRSHKIDPILLYFMCGKLGTQVCRQSVMNEANISTSTFSKHLKMIKQIIERI